MAKGLKKIKDKTGVTPINHRFKWVEFTGDNVNEENGEEPYVIRVKMRTSLTQAEIEKVAAAEGTNNPETVWEAIHAYVPEWDVVVVDENGDYYAVDAPGVSGPEMFKYAPRSLAHAIVYGMISEVFQRVDPKSLKSAEPTAQP